MIRTFQKNRRAMTGALKPDIFRRNEGLIPLVAADPVSGVERELFRDFWQLADPLKDTVLSSVGREGSKGNPSFGQEETEKTVATPCRDHILAAAPGSLLNEGARVQVNVEKPFFAKGDITAVPPLVSEKQASVLLKEVLDRFKQKSGDVTSYIQPDVTSGKKEDKPEFAKSTRNIFDHSSESFEKNLKGGEVGTRSIERPMGNRARGPSHYKELSKIKLTRDLFRKKSQNPSGVATVLKGESSRIVSRALFSERLLSRWIKNTSILPPEKGGVATGEGKKRVERDEQLKQRMEDLALKTNDVLSSKGVSTALVDKFPGKKIQEHRNVSHVRSVVTLKHLLDSPGLKQSLSQKSISADAQHDSIQSGSCEPFSSHSETGSTTSRNMISHRNPVLSSGSFDRLSGYGGSHSHTSGSDDQNSRFNGLNAGADLKPNPQDMNGHVISEKRSMLPEGNQSIAGKHKDVRGFEDNYLMERVDWMEDDDLGQRVSDILRRQAKRRGVELP